MNNIEKAKEIFGLVISAATVIVALANIWKEVGPRVKAIVNPFIDDCRKLTNGNPGNSLQTI